jgi:hypothetical protein
MDTHDLQCRLEDGSDGSVFRIAVGHCRLNTPYCLFELTEQTYQVINSLDGRLWLLFGDSYEESELFTYNDTSPASCLDQTESTENSIAMNSYDGPLASSKCFFSAQVAASAFTKIIQ